MATRLRDRWTFWLVLLVVFAAPFAIGLGFDDHTLAGFGFLVLYLFIGFAWFYLWKRVRDKWW